MDQSGMKVKVCLIGDRAVGKTSLIRRYMLDQFSDEYKKTMGAKVFKTVVFLPLDLRKEAMRIDMTLWDMMGDKTLAELVNEVHFNGVQGILAVCDVTQKESVDSLEHWFDAVPKLVRTLPIYIIVNKSDLDYDVRIVERDVFGLARSFCSPVLMTSAKTGCNVAKAFDVLAKRIVEKELGPDIDFLVEQRFGILGGVADETSNLLRTRAPIVERA